MKNGGRDSLASRLATAATLFLLATPATADLVSIEPNVVLDTNTGIEWHTVNSTRDATYIEAVATYYPQGWRHATRTEICSMADFYGAACGGQQEPGIENATIVDALGNTVFSTCCGSTEGLYDDGDPAGDVGRASIFVRINSFSQFSTTNATDNGQADDVASPNVGHFLVRFPATLSVSDPAESFDSNAASFSFSVNSNSSWFWVASGDTELLTSSEETFQGGDQIFTYFVSPNSAPTPRTATLTFGTPFMQATHTITQSGVAAPVPLLSWLGLIGLAVLLTAVGEVAMMRRDLLRKS